jgi:hypothetical protein
MEKHKIKNGRKRKYKNENGGLSKQSNDTIHALAYMQHADTDTGDGHGRASLLLSYLPVPHPLRYVVDPGPWCNYRLSLASNSLPTSGYS